MSGAVAEAEPGRVDVVVAGAVAHLVLDNPGKMNAISVAMWHALVAAFERCEQDPAVRCIVLRGAGERAFCAGADVAEKDRADHAPTEDVAFSSLRRIQACPRPTIAMISGYCLGAGLALAAACDLRIADRGARFALPAARLGLAPGFDVLRRLTLLIGTAAAKRLLFLGERIDADRALAIGLVDDVVAPDALARSVGDLAAILSGNAPLTIAASKFAIDAAFDGAQAQRAAEYAELERACLASADYAEGRRAFLEKRPPRFTGR